MINSIFRQTNPYERFVEQLVELESQTKYKLEAQKGAQREKKTALGEVSSSISKFINQVEELQDPSNRALRPLSSSSSNKEVVSITSAIDAQAANYRITVDRIAAYDSAISERITADDESLAAGFADGTVEITIGEETRTISVETTKEDENGDIVNKTNDEILRSLADQINEQLGEQARATVYQVNSEEIQLSINSLETGSDNRIQFSGATGVLAEITGGISHLTPQEELDALFTIDGVTFERGSNSVGDAIEGVIFQLHKATGEAETISVSRNMGKARSNIDELISAFNQMNQSIRDRTFLDAENNRRGALQDMRTVRNLTYNMRQTGLLAMEGTEEGQLSRLTEIGIGFNNNGSMYVEDAQLLEEMLQERPDEIEQLLLSEHSVISNMKEQAESYVKRNGILGTLEVGLDQQIERLDNRIAAQNRYLEQYEERQRAIFNELQQIIDQGEMQFQQVMNFRMSLGY